MGYGKVNRYKPTRYTVLIAGLFICASSQVNAKHSVHARKWQRVGTVSGFGTSSPLQATAEANPTNTTHTAESELTMGITYTHSANDAGDARIEQRQFEFQTEYYITTVAQKALFDTGEVKAYGALLIQSGDAGPIWQKGAGSSAKDESISVPIEIEGFPSFDLEITLPSQASQNDSSHWPQSGAFYATCTDNSEHHQHWYEDSTFSKTVGLGVDVDAEGGNFSYASASAGLAVASNMQSDTDNDNVKQLDIEEAFTFLKGY